MKKSDILIHLTPHHYLELNNIDIYNAFLISYSTENVVIYYYFFTITFCFYQVFPNSFSVPFDLTLALINIIIPQIFCIFFVTTSNVLANKFQYFFTNLQINSLKLISFVQVMYF